MKSTYEYNKNSQTVVHLTKTENNLINRLRQFSRCGIK